MIEVICAVLGMGREGGGGEGAQGWGCPPGKQNLYYMGTLARLETKKNWQTF